MVDEDALRARFSLVEIDDEGVLLDRESGDVFRLNRTACAIWALLKSGAGLPAIEATLTGRFGIGHEVAERDARAALLDLPTAGGDRLAVDRETTGCRWEESPSGYVFREQGVVTCEVDREGSSLRLPTGERPTEPEARRRIRSVVARLLALRGIHLLHASAVEIDGALTVFTGPSGAGKTTTARALARTGARLISEDLLVLAPAPTRARAVVGGEGAIRRWVSLQAARLAIAPTQPVLSDGLDQCLSGETLGIREILLLDAARRSGERIVSERLSDPEALIALIESVYFASRDPQTWQARLEALRELVTDTPTSTATVPPGLALLDAAARAFRSGQRETTAS